MGSAVIIGLLSRGAARRRIDRSMGEVQVSDRRRNGEFANGILGKAL